MAFSRFTRTGDRYMCLILSRLIFGVNQNMSIICPHPPPSLLHKLPEKHEDGRVKQDANHSNGRPLLCQSDGGTEAALRKVPVRLLRARPRIMPAGPSPRRGRGRCPHAPAPVCAPTQQNSDVSGLNVGNTTIRLFLCSNDWFQLENLL